MGILYGWGQKERGTRWGASLVNRIAIRSAVSRCSTGQATGTATAATAAAGRAAKSAGDRAASPTAEGPGLQAQGAAEHDAADVADAGHVDFVEPLVGK